MNKSRTPKILGLLVLLTIAVSIATAIYIRAFQKEAPSPPASPTAVSPTPQPDLQMLAARVDSGIAAPTPVQIEEEARTEKEQIEAASLWLQDADPEQRVTGAEQLSAYPTPEAEKLLAESLANDSIPEVRAAAAQSLDSFEKLEENTLQALLTALEDPEEEVRQSALGTLQGLHDRLEGDEKLKEAKKIRAALRKKSKSPSVPMEMQKEIRDYLRDLQ